MKQTYRIFLASSNNLKTERSLFQNLMLSFKGEYEKKKVNLNLDIWENLNSAIDPIRKQDHYNNQLKSCDILVLMYWGELGIFTREEYLLALELFRKSGKPIIYIFKKISEVSFATNTQNLENLEKLEEELRTKDKEQWPVLFDNFDTVIKTFSTDLRDLFEDAKYPHFSYGNLPRLLSSNAPAKPGKFIGRETELARIYKHFNGHSKTLLLNAEGGLGKTTLAAQYWNESWYKYEQYAWLFCGGGILNAIKSLAPDLKVDFTGLNESQQLLELNRALRNLHDDFLLVLDNANDEMEILNFQKEFLGLHWHVLITSRCQGILDKDQEMHIDHLTPEIAKELFLNYYPSENTQDFEVLLDRLLKAINYHTLLIEIFAKNLYQASKLGEKLETFLDKLESNGLYLENDDSFKIRTPYTDYVKKEATNSNKILDILYDFTKLEDEQRFLLVNIALLPAESYTVQFLVELLAPENKRKFFDIIKGLFEKGWLAGSDKTYRISPVVQHLVLIRNKEKLGDDAIKMLSNLQHILGNDGANFSYLKLLDVGQFAKLTSSITKNLERYPTYELSVLNSNAGLYYEKTGDINRAFQFFYNYGKLSLAIGHGENFAISKMKIGSIYEATGDLPNALISYEEQLSMFKEINASNPENLSFKNGFALSYERLGGIYEIIGDLQNAFMNYQEYNRISREIHSISPENLSYTSCLAISFAKLGHIYKATGDWQNAFVNYKERNRIVKEIHASNPDNLQYKNSLAISYEQLGHIYEEVQDWRNAFINYEENFKIREEIHNSSPENLQYKSSLAISNAKMGTIYEGIGDWQNALAKYLEYNRIGKEIYSISPDNLSYKSGFATSYGKLGGIYEATGDWPNALMSYKENFRLINEIHLISPENLSYKNNLATSYLKLGGIYQATRDWQNALANYEENFKITKEIYLSSPENLSYKISLALSYQYLGDIYNWTGDWQNALTNYEENFKLIKDVFLSGSENLSYKNDLAISYERLGSIYEASGDWQNALANYEERNRIGREIYFSSPENLEYKNGLAISFAKLGTLYRGQKDFSNALSNFLKSRTLFAELFNTTQGQIVSFAYYFALNSYDVCRIVKWNVQNEQYPKEAIPRMKEEIKTMRMEAYSIIQGLAKQNKLNQLQMWLLRELDDERWYDF